MRANGAFVAGALIVGGLVLVSVFGPLVYQVDPLDQTLRSRLAPPIWAGGHQPTRSVPTGSGATSWRACCTAGAFRLASRQRRSWSHA
jgi:hypothetical protein